MEDPSKWVSESAEGYDQAQHVFDRATNGFSTYDWWNFNSYLNWIIVAGLEKFKTEGTGHPAALESMDEWRAILDQMIDGFKASEEVDNLDCMPEDATRAEMKAWRDGCQARFDKGMELFKTYYWSLWD